MNRSSRPSVTRITELQQQIARLANLRPADGAVVSCYLDLSQDRSMLQTFGRNRLDAELARDPAARRVACEACIDVIEAQLESDLPLRARGLAIFVAADGKAPVLSATPFAVPFRRSLTVSRSPNLLPLVQLKELYRRFLIVMAEPEGLQLSEVNLGDVSVKVWATSSAHAATEPAGGRSQLKATPSGGLFSQVSLIERHLGKAGSCPVFLAGDVDVMQAIPGFTGIVFGGPANGCTAYACGRHLARIRSGMSAHPDGFRDQPGTQHRRADTAPHTQPGARGGGVLRQFSKL